MASAFLSVGLVLKRQIRGGLSGDLNQSLFNPAHTSLQLSIATTNHLISRGAVKMKRQCGYRKKGGVYLTVPTSDDGAPIEYFLIDPPQPVELEVLGVAPRGVHLIEKEGVWHVFDVVGQDSYPNVCDVLEEGRVLGFSRRCELPDYSKLARESRLVLIHQRAFIRNYREYLERFTEQEADDFKCPRKYHNLDALEEMCAGLWWHDVVEGIERDEGNHRDLASRKLECGALYHCYRQPVEVTPEYEYAIFAIFPTGQIEVIEDPDDRTHEKKLENARQSQLPVTLVSE
jgi:hypothetical protein